jgi:N4-(beta-N-acetylglucosaminyl)-L-asparaginase
MLVGEGAQQFAVSEGFTLESGNLSESADKSYKQWLKKSTYKPVINIERKTPRVNLKINIKHLLV